MKLNLQDINFIINESVKLLTEAISIDAAYQRFYNTIPLNDYKTIVSTVQNDTVNLQDETKWVLNLYKRKTPNLMSDLPKLHTYNNDGYLDIFKRLVVLRKIQGAEGDLGRYKNISDLIDFVDRKMEELDGEEIWGNNTFRKKKNLTDAQKAAKDDIKLHYEDDVWKILTPLSWEASVYWGRGSSWCTAYTDDDSYFENYDTEDLYINICKNDPTKSAQFYLSNDLEFECMDYRNNPYEWPIFNKMTCPPTQGMINFYREVCDETIFLWLSGINVVNNYSFKNDTVYNADGEKLFTEKEIMNKVYNKTGIGCSYCEYTPHYIKLNSQQEYTDKSGRNMRKRIYNILTWDGELVSDIWFDYLYEYDGEIGVKYTDKNNVTYSNSLSVDTLQPIGEWKKED